MPFPNHHVTAYKFENFPVLTHVKVVETFVDWYYFHGDTGVVTSNSGGYLGIMVKFDVPRQIGCDDDPEMFVQYEFNFNPYDLEPIDA